MSMRTLSRTQLILSGLLVLVSIVGCGGQSVPQITYPSQGYVLSSPDLRVTLPPLQLDSQVSTAIPDMSVKSGGAETVLAGRFEGELSDEQMGQSSLVLEVKRQKRIVMMPIIGNWNRDSTGTAIFEFHFLAPENLGTYSLTITRVNGNEDESQQLIHWKLVVKKL